jgi:hypothetical protein
MNEIEILEIRDLLSQQTRDVHTELEAIKLRLPKPLPRWWEIAFQIIATVGLVGLSFIGGLLFHRYLFYTPYNCI